jgi:hypothetical protein
VGQIDENFFVRAVLGFDPFEFDEPLATFTKGMFQPIPKKPPQRSQRTATGPQTSSSLNADRFI